MDFKGLDREAFATYAPDKWSSMVHNLARMRAKGLLVALCNAVEVQIKEELAGLARAASDEIPNITNSKKVDAQWVYWGRGPQEREALASFLKKTELTQAHIFDLAPQDKHAILAVVLRERELWVGVRIAAPASVDRKNLSSKLGKPWERDTLIELMGELPDGATLGLEGRTTPVTDLDSEGLGKLADTLGKDDPPWMVGHAIGPDDAIELGTDLPDHVARWLGAMLPIYRFAAWTRDNDFTEVGKQIQEEKAQKRRQATSYKQGDKVRIVSGLFTGKLGVVESIDTKAQVKVRVGKMSVVVSGHDLIPG